MDVPEIALSVLGTLLPTVLAAWKLQEARDVRRQKAQDQRFADERQAFLDRLKEERDRADERQHASDARADHHIAARFEDSERHKRDSYATSERLANITAKTVDTMYEMRKGERRGTR